jgi:hypothetical protein
VHAGLPSCSAGLIAGHETTLTIEDRWATFEIASILDHEVAVIE